MKPDTVRSTLRSWVDFSVLLLLVCGVGGVCSFKMRLLCSPSREDEKEERKTRNSPRENIKLMPITSQHPRAERSLLRDWETKSQFRAILEINENYQRGMLRNTTRKILILEKHIFHPRRNRKNAKQIFAFSVLCVRLLISILAINVCSCSLPATLIIVCETRTSNA